MTESRPIVSTIVPTLNSEKTLRLCLESIKQQSYPFREIIIVDNYSSDRTREIALNYGQVFLKGPERSTQKNFGATKSQGKYFLFLDSDAELSREVIEECVQQCEQGADAVIIPEEHLGEGYWAQCKSLERKCYLGDDAVEAPWFFRAQKFWDAGGYDEELVAGEDWDLFEKLQQSRARVVRCNAGISHHIGRLALSSSLGKKYYYGLNLPKYIRTHRGRSLRKVPFFRSAYWYKRHLLLRYPELLVGILLMKTLETMAAALGVVWGSIREKR